MPFIYNRHIAPLIPTKTVVYNGVEVDAARYFDSFLPWRKQDDLHYESGLISGLDRWAKNGDHVVIVGGGWGVTAVNSAWNTGESGKVTVYEGSSKEINHIRKTTHQNNVSDRISVRHGVVGPLISLRGDSGEATSVSPEELPECDVLQLDCEGSEINILENLKIRPRVILVESHGMNGAPSSKVEKKLKMQSYSVISKEVADKGKEDICVNSDIHVLVAVRQ